LRKHSPAIIEVWHCSPGGAEPTRGSGGPTLWVSSLRHASVHSPEDPL
jgi:hypothetical protein